MSDYYRINDLIFINRTIGVNLVDFHGISEEHPNRCRPYGADSLYDPYFYTNAEETPKQINPTGFKRVLRHLRFLCKTQFG